jgi:AraC-like DNA-binding protein
MITKLRIKHKEYIEEKEKFLDELETDIVKEVGKTNLSRLFNKSDSYLNRMFKRRVGVTFKLLDKIYSDYVKFKEKK